MDGARQVAVVNVGLLSTAAAVQGELTTGEAAQHGFRNDAMQLLSGPVGVRWANDVHRKFQQTIDRDQMHVERGLGCRVRTGGLNRLLLGGSVLDRAVKLRCTDV